MNSPTDQRVALITGAAKRVGRAIALRLAQAEYDIAFTYLSSQKDADQLIEAISAKGRKCLAIRADLTDPANAAQTIQSKFSERFNRLDVLVNNASIYEPDESDQTDSRQLRRLMAIHFESPMLLCKNFASMLKTNQGHVINMVDVSVERPIPAYKSYCASKAALWNLTLNLARELAPEVTSNGIAPGVVAWAAGTSESEKKSYLSRVPLARAGMPEDVAQAVAFFCSGGSYVTGQILRIDGGRSIT